MKRVLALTLGACGVSVDQAFAGPTVRPEEFSTATVAFESRGVRSSSLMEGDFDRVIADAVIVRAGVDAEVDGFDAVCIDALSDSAADGLRSVLDIPVLGSGRTAVSCALMIGARFSVVTWGRSSCGIVLRNLHAYGVERSCASVRSAFPGINLSELLSQEERSPIETLASTARRCVVEDHAEAICLGATVGLDVCDDVAAIAGVPVINPGPTTWRMIESILTLQLTDAARNREVGGFLRAELVRQGDCEQAVVRWP